MTKRPNDLSPNYQRDNGTTDTSPKTVCSKLYEILKSNPASAQNSAKELHSDAASARSTHFHYLEESLWQCWQCIDTFSEEKSFIKHLRVCDGGTQDHNEQLGCPFCPKDGHQSSEDTFNIKAFDLHMWKRHPNVQHFKCCYCMAVVDSSSLAIVSHIVEEHKVPWRPSPASMVYLRSDQLPHRVVTCMGCGWCTFVLRADNAAQPPSSLATHLDRCIFSGGRVHLERTDTDALMPSLEQLVDQADKVTSAFAEVFPLVRGYAARKIGGPSPRKHRYVRQESDTPSKIQKLDSSSAAVSEPTADIEMLEEIDGDDDDEVVVVVDNEEADDGQELTSPMDTDVMVLRPEAENDDCGSQPEEEEADSPAAADENAVDVYKASIPTRLYVCPLCGDNALASLRKRDEHLQSVHHGERVFPCQICGMAYPLYIMLRKHAAVKHGADFDAVRYGPPELVDSEPVECHVCQLVAFTDPAVLQLHLLALHQKETKKSHVIMATESAMAGAADGRPMARSRGSRNDLSGSSYVGAGGVRSSKSRAYSTGGSRPVSTSRVYGDDGDDDDEEAAAAEEEERYARHRRKMPPIGPLERILSEVTSYPSALSCRICRTVVDNEKELWLHLELDHSESDTEYEQLGCQACGRIFFGPGGRVDLIGHLRVVHQDSDRLDAALTCPHADMAVKRNSGFPIAKRPCDALFSSPRLRHIHSTVSSVTNPGFACPLNLGGAPEPGDRDPDRVRITIMKTEIAADREGLMILAYCCPTCSRLFAGDQATARFAAHHRTCQGSEVVTNDLVLVSDRPGATAFVDVAHSGM